MYSKYGIGAAVSETRACGREEVAAGRRGVCVSLGVSVSLGRCAVGPGTGVDGRRCGGGDVVPPGVSAAMGGGMQFGEMLT